MAIYVRDKLVDPIKNYIITDRTNLLNIIVHKVSLPEILHEFLIVSVDGIPIPIDCWDKTYVDRENVVYIAVIPEGGGDSGGKNPLAMIAMIALTVFSGGTMAASLSSLTGGALSVGAAQAGIMIVGSLAINALFPPPVQKTKAGAYDDSEGFFGVSGSRNRIRQYEGIRSVYGRYRFSHIV